MMVLADLRGAAGRSHRMTRKARHSPGAARAARLGLLGLALGALAGVAAAGDIRSSFSKGRVAPTTFASAPQERAPVAARDGYELAAQLGLSARDDCRTLEPAFRHGCLDYVERRGAGPDPDDLLL
jgi:hypothetical protein